VRQVLDTVEKAAQTYVRSPVGLRMVRIQEATPIREPATALFGGGELLFAELERSEIGHFARRIKLPANSAIFNESEPSVAIYQLTSGIARLYKTRADGRRQIVGFALPGDFLGSPFSNQCPYSVDAISEVAARVFLRGPFLTFLEANPSALRLMLEVLSKEIDAARDHILMLGRGTAEEKFVEFIITWRARVGRSGALANLVPLPMSRRDVADFLGLTIETISRLLAKLEQENVVRVIPEGLQLLGPTKRPFLFERSYRVFRRLNVPQL
jgi:CRP/FNR family transcriptional regulator